MKKQRDAGRNENFSTINVEATPPIESLTTLSVELNKSNVKVATPSVQNRGLHSSRTIIITSSIIILLIGVSIGAVFAIPYLRYNHAESQLNKNEFDKAIKGFAALKDFKDSTQMLNEAIYLKGRSYLDNKDYKQAIDVFSGINEFMDSSELIMEAKYLTAKQEREDNNLESARLILEEIKNYKDSSQLLKKSYYQEALSVYENGDFKEAKELFESLGGYNDSKTYLTNISFMETLQGTWGGYVFNNYNKWIISGWDISRGEDNGIGYMTKGYISEGKFVSGFTFSIENGQLIQEAANGTFKFDRLSYSTTVQTTKKKDPQLGMTPEEVKASTWGKPNDINRTTTKYGTSEQWVYSHNRYIYIDDGLVTAIQD
ncbi:tol-pal system YbgF family protein [Paenibacillus yanchengensis]